MKRSPLELSIVVPVFKEEGNVEKFVTKIQSVLSSLTENYEIIFCLDPSPDRTDQMIRKAREQNSRIKMLVFSRRFGQPMCTLAGMQYARGNAVIVMDVDMQDPPELILDLYRKYQEGYDVVYAQRSNREGETLIKRAVSYVGYKVINRISEIDIPPNTGDFRLMSRRVVNEVLNLKEMHGFLRGLVAFVGFRQTSVQFQRPARFAGAGNYNRFLGSLKIGFNGVFCFSNYALTLSTKLGFTVAVGSMLLGLGYFVAKVAGANFPMGNPTIVILVLFLGGIQLISIGVLGEYVSRIYDEVRHRPKYIVDLEEGFE